MKRIVAFLLCTMCALAVRGEELRIARCDMRRVFDEYQHTIELKRLADERRNVTGPSTAAVREVFEARALELKRVEDELKQAPVGTPAWDALQGRRETAGLVLKINQLRFALDRGKRAEAVEAEMKQWRDMVVGEIMTEARALAEERGYDIIVTDVSAFRGTFAPVIATDRAEDVTDELLKRLNRKYAAKGR